MTSIRSVKTQVVPGAGTGLPMPLGTTPLAQRGSAPGQPWTGQLLDQITEV
ncbi:hypothetical protein ACFY0G_38850 [Streptomyces sp. NPDC001552]|uniref:hypothetical protein n=1 Tax=Streptomyces sp. NPDC001552 TaxID=3364587 RepID=UPI0036D1EF62